MQLTWGATVCWRRTRLPFATAAMADGAATCAVLAALPIGGHILPNVPSARWVPLGIGVVFGPVCLLVESRVHPAEWKAWRDYMEQQRVWEIVTGRHIPQFRERTR